MATAHSRPRSLSRGMSPFEILQQSPRTPCYKPEISIRINKLIPRGIFAKMPLAITNKTNDQLERKEIIFIITSNNRPISLTDENWHQVCKKIIALIHNLKNEKIKDFVEGNGFFLLSNKNQAQFSVEEIIDLSKEKITSEEHDDAKHEHLQKQNLYNEIHSIVSSILEEASFSILAQVSPSKSISLSSRTPTPFDITSSRTTTPTPVESPVRFNGSPFKLSGITKIEPTK